MQNPKKVDRNCTLFYLQESSRKGETVLYLLLHQYCRLPLRKMARLHRTVGLFLLLASSLRSLTPCRGFAMQVKTKPWWEQAKTWSLVDENFNWERRRTGVKPAWTAGLSIWTHYNETALNANMVNPATGTTLSPQPWTQGRMCKFLRQKDKSSFQLHSVYEPESIGFFGGNLMKPRLDVGDGLQEMDFSFRQTPHRITPLPFQSLPDQMIQAGVATSRTTIVQPDAATFAGPRYLPTIAIQKHLLLHQAQQMLFETEAFMDKRKYKKWKFCELWLAEDADTAAQEGSNPEGRKMGIFCQYNGISGELVQVFRIREITLPEDMTPHSPKDPINLADMEDELVKRQYEPWVEEQHLSSVPAQALIQGDPIHSILRDGTWNCTSARAVRIEKILGPELDCSLDDLDDRLSVVYCSPGDENPHLFWDVRFPDGAYARIPRTFHPDQWTDQTPIGMEFGCVRRDGDIHRLLAVGSRHAGGLHTTVYERWSKQSK
jgi:hypothetical protein